MTHEFKKLVEGAALAKQKGLKSVMASVVALDGSSYRRPGVRMLILESGKMIGAVSGGCVEKEIRRQSETVFKTGTSKIMTYDGRYRLGCEGILYILIELFQPDDAFVTAFESCLKKRESFEIASYFSKEEGTLPGIGSTVRFTGGTYSISTKNTTDTIDASLSVFEQRMPPCFRLVIVGAEHDAVQLCKFAALSGWEVTIVMGPMESKTLADFPGAKDFHSVAAESMDTTKIDSETAVIMMTHNFANDLKYLVALKDTHPIYLGLLGPAKRREKLLSEFMEYCPDLTEAFLEHMYAPAGIDIGAETPQEIAISIISEILSVIRAKRPMSLRNKRGGIHD